MKQRRFWAVLLGILLLISVTVAASAESGGKLPYVTDAANLLTDEQHMALEARAEEISQTYSFGIYIIAVNDYTDYSRESDFWDANVDIYETYDLGWGTEKAGASFMISMAERDFRLHFNSDRANYVFSEAGRDAIEDRVITYLQDNDYYSAFNEYLNACQEYLEAAENGTPIAQGQPSRNDAQKRKGFSILFFLPGLFAAGVAAVCLVAPMRSAGVKSQADDYTVPGSMRLTRQSDHFLRRTVSRQPKPTENRSSGSGGGSVTTSHSTGSHSGRTGKF